MASPKGRKFDTGKDRYDLVCELAEREWVRVLTFGAEKYTVRDKKGRVVIDGSNNWRLVPDLRRRYWSAIRRHLKEYALGHRVDPESGRQILAHVLCDVGFLLELDLEGADHIPDVVERKRPAKRPAQPKRPRTTPRSKRA